MPSLFDHNKNLFPVLFFPLGSVSLAAGELLEQKTKKKK